MGGKKKRKQVGLSDAEWAFHKVDESEQDTCLRHELWRGYRPRPAQTWLDKPWLKLSSAERHFLMTLHKASGVDTVPLLARALRDKETSDFDALVNCVHDYAQSLAKRVDPLWKSPVESVNLVIDWRTSDTKLRRGFDWFLRSERRKPFSAASQYKRFARINKTGRGRDVGRRLVDIAVLRCKAAGLNRPQTISLIRPLLEAFQFLQPGAAPREGGLFSGKNWSATLKKARAE